jgi:hypothetical protein
MSITPQTRHAPSLLTGDLHAWGVRWQHARQNVTSLSSHSARLMKVNSAPHARQTFVGSRPFGVSTIAPPRNVFMLSS